jgi:hypothetical protein
MNAAQTERAAFLRIQIVTSLDPPPIPIRSMDWAARTTNYDGGDPIGRGATEQEAIDDLLDWLEERL